MDNLKEERVPTLPMVTCIIPCHNHERWVTGAIESVAIQDYPNKQVCVIDDGSRDFSRSIILELMKDVKKQSVQNFSFSLNSSKINNYKENENLFFGKVPNTNIDIMLEVWDDAKGPSFARNRGIALSRDFTDLYAFLDSDDIYEQGKLTKSVQIWMTAPDIIGGVYSDYDTVNSEGIRHREYKIPYSRESLLRDCIINCDSLVSKAAIDAVGGFDETLRVCEDYDLWMRVSEKFILAHIPESLVTIRIGEHSSTDTVAKATWDGCYQRVFQKMMERK